MKDKVVERFLNYVKFDTQSDPNSEVIPSTIGQVVFASALVQELRMIGLEEVELDHNGYVMATLPSNLEMSIPVVGFIAHMDTSPDYTGYGVDPIVISSYPGGDIILDDKVNIIFSASIFPEINNYIGQEIIVTNGRTLLGADDKAGIAEIVTAMEYLVKHPEIGHGKIRIAFTPDEEIGKGADHFDVLKFGADFAYTIDGGEVGSLEYENFNAAAIKVFIQGNNVHPGYAKNKMKNSMMIANRYLSMIPGEEVPESTSEYEGFYHLTRIMGDVEHTVMEFIVRDFDKDKFQLRKDTFNIIAEKINTQFGSDSVKIEIKDQYFNMHDLINEKIYVVNMAKKAISRTGIIPKILPIRGGTDGARLSFMGLPCPNIFAGGHNFHGKYEFIPTQSMEKACQVIVEIARIIAEK